MIHTKVRSKNIKRKYLIQLFARLAKHLFRKIGCYVINRQKLVGIFDHILLFVM